MLLTVQPGRQITFPVQSTSPVLSRWIQVWFLSWTSPSFCLWFPLCLTSLSFPLNISLSPHCPDFIPKTLKKTRLFLPELSIQCSNLDWNCSLRSHLPPKLFASFTEFPLLKPGRKQGPALPASSELTLWLRSALCFSLLASGPLNSFSRHLHPSITLLSGVTVSRQLSLYYSTNKLSTSFP